MTGRDVDNSMGTGPGDRGSAEVEAALRHALAEPATAEELGDWDVVAAAYRSSVRSPRGRRLHLVAGLPLSAATAAAMLLPAGAVAAAYTGRLPAHVQHWAHRALAPIGVPSHRRSAPDEPRRHHAPSPSPTPYRLRVPGPAALPAPQHARAVQLCITLSHTPREAQGHVLTALQALLPREQDLHQTCRTLLVSPRERHRSPAPSASPEPRAARTAPSPTAAATGWPAPSPSPSASSSR